MKSVVYLCCPVQTREGWVYLTAVASVLRGDWDGDAARRLLPARQLDFRDSVKAFDFACDMPPTSEHFMCQRKGCKS